MKVAVSIVKQSCSDPGLRQLRGDALDQKIYRTASEAPRRKFSPEFVNRVDKVVVFRSLKQEGLGRIVDLELGDVQRRIDDGAGEKFTVMATATAKEFLLAEGTDYRYGASHLKRAIERFVVSPLANLAATRQLRLGDVVVVDRNRSGKSWLSSKDENETSLAAAALLASYSVRVAAESVAA